MPMTGQPIFIARSMTLTIFSPNTSPRRAAEDREVLGEDADRAAVDGAVAGDDAVAVRAVALQAEAVDRCRASSSISTNEPSSSSCSIRSRAVFLPLACCFSTARAEPACTASSLRRVQVGQLAGRGVRGRGRRGPRPAGVGGGSSVGHARGA